MAISDSDREILDRIIPSPVMKLCEPIVKADAELKETETFHKEISILDENDQKALAKDRIQRKYGLSV